MIGSQSYPVQGCETPAEIYREARNTSNEVAAALQFSVPVPAGAYTGAALATASWRSNVSNGGATA